MTNTRKTRFKVITPASSTQTTDQVVTQVSELVKLPSVEAG